MEALPFNASTGVPVSPFLLMQTAGPHTPNPAYPPQGFMAPHGHVQVSGPPSLFASSIVHGPP